MRAILQGDSLVAAMAAVVVISPGLRLYVTQLFEGFRQWLFELKDLL